MSPEARKHTLVHYNMSAPPLDEDAYAAADKVMEERANRAKALLANRYQGLKTAQVRNNRQDGSDRCCFFLTLDASHA